MFQPISHFPSNIQCNHVCLKIFIQDKVAISAHLWKNLCNFIVYKDICIDVYFTYL